MTPGEIVEAARNRYNAVGDSFWSTQEIYDLIYQAISEVADEGLVIERDYTTTTVSDTQEYDFPTAAIAIKRVTWNGTKLTKIDMIEDDVVTGLNQETTATGNPEYYWVWQNTISLRPVPGSAETLKIWAYVYPSEITTATQVLELPVQFHHRLINYVLHAMSAKDSNYEASKFYLALWERDKVFIKQSMRRQKRADKFTTVKDEQMIVETYLGG